MLKFVLTILVILILFPPPIEKIRYNIRIIIGLSIIIFIFNNIEGFGTGIDGEALRNIASLYNNADGTLNVRNLKATGNITADGNITTDGALNTNEINILRTNGRIQGPTKVGGLDNAKTFTIFGDGYITTKNNMVINGDITTSGTMKTNTIRPAVTTEDLNIFGPRENHRLQFTNNYDGITLYVPEFNVSGGSIYATDITATGAVKTNNIKPGVANRPLIIYGPNDNLNNIEQRISFSHGFNAEKVPFQWTSVKGANLSFTGNDYWK